MDNMGKKMRALFDFQRFEQEPTLKGVIDDTKARSSGIRLLTDDELE